MLIVPSSRSLPGQPMVQDWELARPEYRLVSIIVACLGQLGFTSKLVESLEAHAGAKYELILVDNGCPEGTADYAARKGIRCVRFPENRGVPAAYNAGVKEATGDIIAVWNNDMVCLPGGVRRLADAASIHGIASQSAGAFNARGDHIGSTAEWWWGDYAEGYCLTARRDVWQTVGEWDREYWPSYCDDSDWGLRARLAGHDFRLVPDAVVHYGQRTSQHMVLNDIIRANQQRLWSRYGNLGLGQRLLVQRWGAQGDLLMTTPAIRALRRAAPLTRVHVVCHPGGGQLLMGNPDVDAVYHTCPNRALYSRFIDLNHAYEPQQKHGVFEHPALAFCRIAGVEYDGEPYRLTVPKRLQDWAREVLPGNGANRVALGLRSGTRPKQNMRGRNWLALAEALPDRQLVAIDHQPRPDLGPHGREPEDARFWAAANVADVTGQTPTIMHAAALIERCAAFVGVDSGLLHVAAALDVPVVNLCAAAPEHARTPLSGRRAAFEGRAPCFPCQYPEACPVADHCLDWVPMRQVAAIVDGFLGHGEWAARLGLRREEGMILQEVVAT